MLSLGSAKAWPRTSPGEPGTEGEYHRGVEIWTVNGRRSCC
ncbi:hypothetical protein HOLDEFILI_01801 [Holdemania filiformis DSM 12042]|uniref:Uncharacterized protein n=1 Tax=Holdemania filiformis DSM 12042 TaxID=545696 RepID=B9Y7K6_9FIRM|nr:hypothetical protein HOLDEFILI_01801 [Holdemania filiformis DSM 12042]